MISKNILLILNIVSALSGVIFFIFFAMSEYAGSFSSAGPRQQSFSITSSWWVYLIVLGVSVFSSYYFKNKFSYVISLFPILFLALIFLKGVISSKQSEAARIMEFKQEAQEIDHFILSLSSRFEAPDNEKPVKEEIIGIKDQYLLYVNRNYNEIDVIALGLVKENKIFFSDPKILTPFYLSFQNENKQTLTDLFTLQFDQSLYIPQFEISSKKLISKNEKVEFKAILSGEVSDLKRLKDQSLILTIKNISTNQVKVPNDLKSFNYIDLFLIDTKSFQEITLLKGERHYDQGQEKSFSSLEVNQEKKIVISLKDISENLDVPKPSFLKINFDYFVSENEGFYKTLWISL
jgi:hypothetical protein